MPSRHPWQAGQARSRPHVGRMRTARHLVACGREHSALHTDTHSGPPFPAARGENPCAVLRARDCVPQRRAKPYVQLCSSKSRSSTIRTSNPRRHWELDDKGQPTQKIVESRRKASSSLDPQVPEDPGQRKRRRDLKPTKAGLAKQQEYQLPDDQRDARAGRRMAEDARRPVDGHPATARLLKHRRCPRAHGYLLPSRLLMTAICLRVAPLMIPHMPCWRPDDEQGTPALASAASRLSWL